MLSNALNFADRWRALLESKIKGCERHQRERPDRAAVFNNTRRILIELLFDAQNEWNEAK